MATDLWTWLDANAAPIALTRENLVSMETSFVGGCALARAAFPSAGPVGSAGHWAACSNFPVPRLPVWVQSL